MTFVLGQQSLSRLEGVHPRLVAVVKHAITLTRQDFIVFEGLRTLEKQASYVAKGVSWTMNSKHLRQPDGFGYAVDLVPWISGKPVWDWEGCYDVAAAVAEASRGAKAALRWGGVWDRQLVDLPARAEAVKAAVASYAERRRKAGKRAATDGPHFELVSV